MKSGPLSVAVVAHVRHPVARPFMGGMEAHSWHLVQALRARGHDVTLFASGDSETDAKLRPILAEHYDRRYPWARSAGTPELTAHLDGGYGAILDELASERYDIVHNNSLHRFVPRLSRRDRVAMVTSLHIPPFEVLRRAIHESVAPWHAMTTASRVQRRVWWPDGPPASARTVPNGIDLDAWPFVAHAVDDAVWVGRIMALKGTHLAIAAAKAAGMPLTLYGAIEDRGYFDREVRPHLGGAVRYGGHLDQATLAARIGTARVFVFTPLWDEPFGLVAAEAMACGVPVAALDRGAVREVVGRTGAISTAETPEALAAAMRRAAGRPRTAARARVAARFSLDAMVDGYESLYRLAMRRTRARLPEVSYAPWMIPPHDALPVAV